MSWQPEFRDHFPILREKTYANIAYTSPVAPVVTRAVSGFLDDITYARSDKPQWLADADVLRGRLAGLIGGEGRRLAFTKNTTEGINIVAQGLRWEAGDNVVVDDQEHPTNALPWLNLRRQGVEVRVAPAREHYFDVEDLWSRVDTRTRLIAVSWVQYSTGLRVDIAELGRRCKAQGVWLVVDGIQAAGLLRAQVDAWHVDAFAAGAHKGLLGPLGIGLLHVSPRLLEALTPAHVGPNGVTTLNKAGGQWEIAVSDAGDARRLETGNLNFPGVAGWAAAVQLIESAEPARIEPYVLDLATRLGDGLRDLGLDVVSPLAGPAASTTRVLRLPDPQAALARLAAAGIVATVVEYGYLRLSIGAYNDSSDIENILRAAAALR
ncbi:aminotransferase class V-fold PLP-dependent enzyme [Bordetella sp. N]|uniref:aminotransferase class V-fold PLP-dependent enzyme n=1 Tax=Bordetella sp. N TaxID=1746199 RepID=UPI00070BC1A9|nr:aminotransferase class V-fold PLP-dependent enzyme [Bordetella sp. N]ALM81638.1 aminotransferase [Bordetella sp. N]